MGYSPSGPPRDFGFLSPGCRLQRLSTRCSLCSLKISTPCPWRIVEQSNIINFKTPTSSETNVTLYPKMYPGKDPADHLLVPANLHHIQVNSHSHVSTRVHLPAITIQSPTGWCPPAISWFITPTIELFSYLKLYLPWTTKFNHFFQAAIY